MRGSGLVLIYDRASTNPFDENKSGLDKEHENEQPCAFSHSHANARRAMLFPEGESSAIRDGLRE